MDKTIKSDPEEKEHITTGFVKQFSTELQKFLILQQNTTENAHNVQRTLENNSDYSSNEEAAIQMYNIFEEILKNIGNFSISIEQILENSNKNRKNVWFTDLQKRVQQFKDVNILKIVALLENQRKPQNEENDAISTEHVPDIVNNNIDNKRRCLSLKRFGRGDTQDTDDDILENLTCKVLLKSENKLDNTELLKQVKTEDNKSECVDNEVDDDIWDEETVCENMDDDDETDPLESVYNAKITNDDHSSPPIRTQHSSLDEFEVGVKSSSCLKENVPNTSAIQEEQASSKDEDDIFMESPEKYEPPENTESTLGKQTDLLEHPSTEMIIESTEESQSSYTDPKDTNSENSVFGNETQLLGLTLTDELQERSIKLSQSSHKSDVDDSKKSDKSSQDTKSKTAPAAEELENNQDQDTELTEPICSNVSDETQVDLEDSEKDGFLKTVGLVPNDLQYPSESDDLLQLLKEVKVDEYNLPIDSDSTNADNQEEKAERLCQMMLDESSFEFSDSEAEDDNNDDRFSFKISDDDNTDVERQLESDVEMSDKGTNEIQTNIFSKTLQIKLIDCVLYNFTYASDNDSDRRSPKSDTDDINRLCDLSTLGKRKHSTPPPSARPRKKHRKTLNTSVICSDTDTDINSDSSDGSRVSNRDVIVSPALSFNSDNSHDAFAAALCDQIRNSSEESDSSTNTSTLFSEIIEKNCEKTGSEDKSTKDKKKLTEEERRRRAWRNDKLLRGRLLSDSSDSSGSEDVRENRERLRKRKTMKLHSSSNNDSDSDKTVIDTQNMPKSELNDYEQIDSDSSDLEIEIVSSKISNTICISDDELEINSSKKGRRNIRALMSDEKLAQDTQRANFEEKERIQRIEELKKARDSLSQSSPLDETEDCLVLDPNDPIIKVHPVLTKRMKPHQREGVSFMWLACYESVERLKRHKGSGCILAHCMGLGKTFQVICLIHTLFTHDVTNTKHVLVICPLSTVSNWKNEFKIAFKDLKNVNVKIHAISNKKDSINRVSIVKRWRRQQGVLILGYEAFETLTRDTTTFAKSEFKDDVVSSLLNPGPDLVICDEGHMLRNRASNRAIAVNKIRTRRRICLTGTPLQNNLKEYYQMVNFVKPDLLGTMKEFQTNFINPIVNGQHADSTTDDIRLMKKRTHVLHRRLEETIQRYEASELAKYLPRIIDYAMFIKLHPKQMEMYKKYIEIALERLDYKQKGFLSDWRKLTHICSHLHIFKILEKKNKQITPVVQEQDVINLESDDCEPRFDCNWWKTMLPEDTSSILDYGTKFCIMKLIIEESEALGDKILIFSQSRAEMDCIEHFLKTQGTKKCSRWLHKEDYYRMDGNVLVEDRSVMCDNFNNVDNKRLRVFIMSHKVGGLGLNLVAANRVIIMGVNFNPSFDTQSVFRAYRFGQTKECYIYRLISKGTIEQTNYQRSVTKLAIASRVVDKHQITRHYKSVQLQDIYKYNFDDDLSSPRLNLPEDKLLAAIIVQDKSMLIREFHKHQDLLQNRPDEGLDDQEKAAAWEEFMKINEKPSAPPFEIAPAGLPTIVNDGQKNLYYNVVHLKNNHLPSTSSAIPSFDHTYGFTRHSGPWEVPKNPDKVINVHSHARDVDQRKRPWRVNTSSDDAINVHSNVINVDQAVDLTTTADTSYDLPTALHEKIREMRKRFILPPTSVSNDGDVDPLLPNSNNTKVINNLAQNGVTVRVATTQQKERNNVITLD